MNGQHRKVTRWTVLRAKLRRVLDYISFEDVFADDADPDDPSTWHLCECGCLMAHHWAEGCTRCGCVLVTPSPVHAFDQDGDPVWNPVES